MSGGIEGEGPRGELTNQNPNLKEQGDALKESATNIPSAADLGPEQHRQAPTKTITGDASQTKDTAPDGNAQENLRAQIASLPIMEFIRSGMTSEAYAELENSICRNVIKGAALLGMSEAEYVKRIGISLPRSHRPGKKGARF